MSKKDYIKVAAELRWAIAQDHNDEWTLRRFARQLAAVYADDNPAFDRSRFMDAVLPEQEPVR